MGEEIEVAADWTQVERFRNGAADARRGAFCALYDRHAGPVQNYLLRLSGNPHLAEDLTQEAFLRAYNGLDGFNGQCSFKTWVFQIAINLHRDHLRGNRRMDARAAKEMADPQPAPEALAERDETAQQVRRAVDSLPAELREALMLVRFEGMKYREAALALGITTDAVRMRVHRAHVALVPLLTA